MKTHLEPEIITTTIKHNDLFVLYKFIKQKKIRLLAFETWCYRRPLRISWTEHVSNEEVYRKSGEIRSFLKTLKTRRANLIGHVLRHNSQLSRIIECATEGNNSRG
uniref:RNA-directed DNA polymerase n=1 Tax=Sipha flava TaxID=143950 RepID=A0A2S2QZ71_9HEMI